MCHVDCLPGACFMSFEDLVDLMNTLRGEKGCPWDKKQTLDSLKPFLIEEPYEVIEAIEHRDAEKLKEELGDLLFHILFMSKVSSDRGEFDIEDVIAFVYKKMRRRHPHVFEAASRENAEEVLAQWHEMKRRERAKKGIASLMDGIPAALPALQKAEKVQRRAAQVGFDWERPEGVLEKITEEIEELKRAISRQRQESISDEVGDLLFSVVNLCRFLAVEAEGALRGTIAKFTERFREIERRVASRGESLRDLSLEEMDMEWTAAKGEEPRRTEGG
jgi:tetrapyrrole methylase family protein/MazG family protein